MNSNRYRIFCALSVLALAAYACVVPSVAPAQPTAKGSSAESLASTQTALAGQPTVAPPPAATDTALPSPTFTQEVPTETPTAEILPSDTPAATPMPVIAEVMKETNCRSGPAGNYSLVTTFAAGTKLEVEAQDLGGGFIFVKNPTAPDANCYVLANNVKITGDVSVLPQYTPMPSPTLMPNISVTFKKFDVCKGNYFAQFVIQNTGSVSFKSVYIRITNTKNNEVVEKAADAFDLYTGCIIAKNITPLDPGATGYLSSELFKVDPRAYRLRVVIQACTEKSLKGSCVTTSLEIKP